MVFATADVGFKQQVPHIQNAFLEDPVLVSILERLLPDHVLKEISPDLVHIADWSNTEGAELIKRMEDDQPRLRQYDHWCRRVDDLLVTEAWKKQKEVAAREGIVAIAYERKYGQHSRIYQMAKLMLWTPGAGLYSCPIAMTDGCARVLELLGTPDMKDQVYSRLTSRDPSRFFTSGQWMTERPGGSDVGRTETQAVWNEDLKAWSVSGFKWFSSATDADVTMLLARTHDPDPSIAPGNMKAGSRGLSLYLSRVRNDDGKLNGVRIHRLKDKVGTKALPTAELQLEGMMWSAKNAFAMSQEAMECFGGQGYMEETGIGRMMRDVLVNTIWKGTSNVMSLDVLRVMTETSGGVLQVYSDTVRSMMAPLRLRPEWTKSCKSLEECLVLIAIRFTSYATPDGRKILESSARGLSLAMADVFAGALLCQHAAWSESKAKANPSDQVAAAAARVDQISGQRWCEELYRRVEYQIQTLGQDERYEQDHQMLFGLVDARRAGLGQTTGHAFGEAKL
ncbi:acyl-CoA dehydrogenase/oxidase [Mortierella sp. GBAus27b]|nr:acyl-CoA dehydrogenase/oxidase [Mortierella sp. GBAus27b]